MIPALRLCVILHANLAKSCQVVPSWDSISFKASPSSSCRYLTNYRTCSIIFLYCLNVRSDSLLDEQEAYDSISYPSYVMKIAFVAPSPSSSVLYCRPTTESSKGACIKARMYSLSAGKAKSTRHSPHSRTTTNIPHPHIPFSMANAACSCKHHAADHILIRCGCSNDRPSTDPMSINDDAFHRVWCITCLKYCSKDASCPAELPLTRMHPPFLPVSWPPSGAGSADALAASRMSRHPSSQ